MNVATIEVKSTADPEEGKKQGSVFTADGQKFKCWPDMLGRFRPGNAYKVEFDTTEYKGHTIRTIKRAKPAPNAMAPIEQERSSRPAPSLDTPTNQELMFVTRVLSAMVQGGRVAQSEEELAKAAQMLRGAYRRIFGT